MLLLLSVIIIIVESKPADDDEDGGGAAAACLMSFVCVMNLKHNFNQICVRDSHKKEGKQKTAVTPVFGLARTIGGRDLLRLLLEN